MRTNIEIDDGLLEQARRLTGLGTKRAIVDYALRELIARERQRDILNLRGVVLWEDDLEESRGGRDPR